MEEVVVLPVFSLPSCGQRGEGGLEGELMISEGEILDYEFYLFWVLLEHLLEYRHQPGAVRSLEIAEGDDLYFRVRVAFNR